MKCGTRNLGIRKIDYFIPKNKKNNHLVQAIKIKYPCEGERTIIYRTEPFGTPIPIKAYDKNYAGVKTTFKPNAQGIWVDDSGAQLAVDGNKLFDYALNTQA